MYQIQTWFFGVKGSVCHTLGDPEKAEKAIGDAFGARNVREVCVWRPDYSVTHATRTAPDAPWRMIKGVR